MHKVLLVVLLSTSLALAGCSDSGGGGSDAPASSSTSTTTGPPPKPVVLSDTLHLLAPPTMALALPEGQAEVRTPSDSGFGGGGGGGGGGGQANDEWTYRATQVSNITAAEAKIWIEITETLLPSPSFPNPTQPACTWMLILELGADGGNDIGCLSEPAGPISAGIKELTFSFLGLDSQLELNETITLSFRRTAFSPSTETSVFILSGSAAHDSRIQFTGFSEPVPGV